MDTLKRFNAALAYIEMNLDSEIDNKEISNIALCSIYQFQTLFAAMSGITLAEYIRKTVLGKHTVATTFTGETSSAWLNIIISQLYQLCFDVLFIEFFKDFADNNSRVTVLA